MSKKLYIQTYGCQMNQYDSERIARVMERQGYRQTDRIDAADVILLNTCSVRDKAEQKVYSVLGTWKEFKEFRSGVIIGVGGCVAQQEGGALLKRVPHLDLVFGTQNIHKLPEMVEQAAAAHARPVEIAFYRDPAYMEDTDGRTQVRGVKAYVTIMQGCNKVCSFCIVPHVRGRELSRPSARIVAEVEALVNQGVVEVMLLGQNVNSYGKRTRGASIRSMDWSASDLPPRIRRIFHPSSSMLSPASTFFASICICLCNRDRIPSSGVCAAAIRAPNIWIVFCACANAVRKLRSAPISSSAFRVKATRNSNKL
jgi:MiaB/RimO family radical SAM methylthiotransferase